MRVHPTVFIVTHIICVGHGVLSNRLRRWRMYRLIHSDERRRIWWHRAPCSWLRMRVKTLGRVPDLIGVR